MKIIAGQKSIGKKRHAVVTCSVRLAITGTEYWARCTINLSHTLTLIFLDIRMSCFTLGTKEDNVLYGHQLILNCISVGSHRYILCLCLLACMQELLLIRVYYKNPIFLYADYVVTNVCFHVSIISIIKVDRSW